MDYRQKIEELETTIKQNGFADQKALVHTILMKGIFHARLGEKDAIKVR